MIKTNEIKVEPVRLYQNDFWLSVINDEKYESIRNKITESFKDLIFEEGPHKYFLHGRELTCVSDITHKFKEHFNSDAMAEECALKGQNDPEYKYAGMTKEEILEAWKKNSQNACEHGSERHNFGESLCWFMMGRLEQIVPEFKDRLHIDENGKYYMEALYAKEVATVNFWKDISSVKSIIPILAENKTFIIKDEYAYSGTFDILFYYDATIDGKDDRYSGLCIYDYKTNKDLMKNFNDKRLLEPFEFLKDMPLSLYKLQLSAYENNLANLGLKIVARRLIWLKPDATYEKIKLESYAKKLDEALKELGKQGKL